MPVEGHHVLILDVNLTCRVRSANYSSRHTLQTNTNQNRIALNTATLLSVQPKPTEAETRGIMTAIGLITYFGQVEYGLSIKITKPPYPRASTRRRLWHIVLVYRTVNVAVVIRCFDAIMHGDFLVCCDGVQC